MGGPIESLLKHTPPLATSNLGSAGRQEALAAAAEGAWCEDVVADVATFPLTSKASLEPRSGQEMLSQVAEGRAVDSSSRGEKASGDGKSRASDVDNLYEVPLVFVEQALSHMMNFPSYITAWQDIYRSLLGALEARDEVERECLRAGCGRGAAQWLRAIESLQARLGPPAGLAGQILEQTFLEEMDWTSIYTLCCLIFRLQGKLPHNIQTRFFDWRSLPELVRLDCQQVGSYFAALRARGASTAAQASVAEAFAAIAGGDSGDDADKTRLMRRWANLYRDLERQQDFTEVCLHFALERLSRVQYDSVAWRRIVDEHDFGACLRRLDALEQSFAQLQSHTEKMRISCLRQPQQGKVQKTLRDQMATRLQAQEDLSFLRNELKTRQKAFYRVAAWVEKTFEKNPAARHVTLSTCGMSSKLELCRDGYRQKIFAELMQCVIANMKKLETVARDEQDSDHRYYNMLQNTSRSMVERLTAQTRELRGADAVSFTRAEENVLEEAEEVLVAVRLLEQERASIGFLPGEVLHFSENFVLYHNLSLSFCRLERHLEKLLAACRHRRSKSEPDNGAGGEPAPLPSQDWSAIHESPHAVVPGPLKAPAASLVDEKAMWGPLDLGEEKTDDDWQVAGRKKTPTISKETRKLIEAVFDRGSFVTPLRSCVYHFSKHTCASGRAPVGLQEEALLDYVRDAQKALRAWAGSSDPMWTYSVRSTVHADLRLQVVNAPFVYLVRTPGRWGRVVSFRNRQRYGF